MSNYTTDNLILVLYPENGVPAIRIGDQVFAMASGGSGATDFYKCASVDTVNHTWTGYKAVLSGGVYSFESTVTSGLTYGLAYTPKFGRIYNDSADIIVSGLWTGIVEDGLIRYAPLSGAEPMDALGESLTTDGSPVFGVDSGISCAAMDSTSYIGYTNAITSLSSYTFSIWMKRIGEGIFTLSGGYYGSGGNEVWLIYTNDSQIALNDGESNFYTTTDTFTGWQHICVVWTGSVFRLYIGGIKQGSDISHSYNSSGSLYAYINSIERATPYVHGEAKYAAFRLYNRVLTDDEITTLSKEFTPSAS